ncbi:MAG: alpha/beta fold hydrolase [Lautropia sp.]
MRARFIDVDGTCTRVLTSGDPARPAILLLHGFGGTADLWIRNFEALGRHFFVVAPDLIGSGFSCSDRLDAGTPPQPIMLQHLRALVDTLGLQRFCASGSSYGALMAGLLYFDMPERIDRLIINGSANCFNPESALSAALIRMRDNYLPFLEDPDLESCRRTMQGIVHDPASVPEEILPVMLTAYSQPWLLSAWKGALQGLMDMDAARQYRIFDRLEQIRVPTLLLWGHDDVGAPYEYAVQASRRIPGARLVGFRDCGHKPMFEHADAYNQHVIRFLSERG